MYKYKYILTKHTQHSKTSQDILMSDVLQDLIDTADYLKHRIYKDEIITVTENITTGELMHIVERG